MSTTETETEPKPAAAAAPVEMVRKVYARDLREKDRVHTVFRVSRKSRTTARSGKVFLALTLEDRTGEMDARIFERVEEAEPAFAEGDYLLVEGGVISFHGKLQLVIEKLERLDPEPIDPAEFTPRAPEAKEHAPEEDRPPAPLRELMDRVHDPHLRAIVRAMAEDPEVAEGLRAGHGPRGTPWAHRGGLAEHLVSFARLAIRIAEHFPQVDRDLVLAGAIIQHLGRAQGAADRPFETSDRGRLVGAAATAAQLVRERARALEGFPPLLEDHLSHLALAGQLLEPATLEALVLRSARELEDRVGSWLEAMARDPGGGNWTDPARHPDGALWKGTIPTARGRVPAEPKARQPRRKDGHRAEPREPKEPRDGKEGKPRLSFKPLVELSPGEPPPAAGDASSEPPSPTPATGGEPEVAPPDTPPDQEH